MLQIRLQGDKVLGYLSKNWSPGTFDSCPAMEEWKERAYPDTGRCNSTEMEEAIIK